MCGVIVVHAGRSRSTNLGSDAYILICLDIVIIIWGSINFPTLICSPTDLLFFSREATCETYGPRVSSSYYLPLWSIFICLLFSDLLNQKIQKYLASFYLYLFYLTFDLSIYYNLFHVCLPMLRRRYPKGIDKPFTRRVASICYLCAGVVYVVLLGSPTGSITLVSSLREIPTAVVLHHPFLFGKIPM